MNMSSGLDFRYLSRDDPSTFWTRANAHIYVYTGAIDVFEHSINRPLEYPPGGVWRYHNCDTLSLGKLVRQTVEARGEEYLSFPQRALFDWLGMRGMVLEPDPYGNFIMTGFDYGRARDWARFGLLHLHDGIWQGQRILPEGWVDFVRTPAPADPTQGYGGQFWLNRGGRHAGLPRDAFWAEGAWGQITLIVPSRQVVIVHQGHVLPGGVDAHVFPDLAEILASLPGG
jgi:CubicO group peptidase (beta-lactamase class C family)